MPARLPATRLALPRRRFLAGGLSLAALVAGCAAPTGQVAAPAPAAATPRRVRTGTARRRSRRTRSGW